MNIDGRGVYKLAGISATPCQLKVYYVQSHGHRVDPVQRHTGRTDRANRFQRKCKLSRQIMCLIFHVSNPWGSMKSLLETLIFTLFYHQFFIIIV